MSGGYSGEVDTEFFVSMEKYDIANDTWTTGPSMETPRAAHSSCCLGQNFYVFAGRNATGYLNSIEFINENALINNVNARWELIQVSTDIMMPCDGVLVAPLNASQIAILGGYTVSTGPCSGDVRILDVRSKRVNRAATASVQFSGLFNQCMQYEEGKIVALVKDYSRLLMLTYNFYQNKVELVPKLSGTGEWEMPF